MTLWRPFEPESPEPLDYFLSAFNYLWNVPETEFIGKYIYDERFWNPFPIRSQKDLDTVEEILSANEGEYQKLVS